MRENKSFCEQPIFKIKIKKKLEKIKKCVNVSKIDSIKVPLKEVFCASF